MQSDAAQDMVIPLRPGCPRSPPESAAAVGASSPSSLAADSQLGHKLDGRGQCAHVGVDNVWREAAYLGQESVKVGMKFLSRSLRQAGGTRTLDERAE